MEPTRFSPFPTTSTIVNDGNNAATPGTFAVGVSAPQTTYLGLFQTTIGQGLVALRVNQQDTGSPQDGLKVVNASSSYALKVDQTNSSTPHDAVNVNAQIGGAHTAVGVLASNTTLSTVKVTNDAVQTGGQVIAALGTNASRTAAIFGADNYGSGASFLSTMEAGATGPAFQAIYDAGGGYSSRALYISGKHTGGALAYIENAGIQTAGAVLQLVQLSSSSSAPILQLTPNGATGNQITANSFSVDSVGTIHSAQLVNFTGFNNARVMPQTTGTTIDRNIADANSVLIVSNIHASSTGDVIQIKGAGASLASRFNKAGYFMTKLNAAPADADVSTSEVAMWFDNTIGAAKVNFKGKNSAGTVVTAVVALS